MVATVPGALKLPLPKVENVRVSPLILSALDRSPEGRDRRALICRAIATGRLMAIDYGGGMRVLEPAVHGFSADGTELLTAYQRDGASGSGCPSGWRTFTVNRMEVVEVLDIPLMSARLSNYHRPAFSLPPLLVVRQSPCPELPSGIVSFRRVGRPRMSREAAFEAIDGLPRAGRGLVYLNRRVIASQLGCCRATVGTMVLELEKSHRLRRLRRKGSKGLLVQLPTPPRWLPPTRIMAVVDGATISELQLVPTDGK